MKIPGKEIATFLQEELRKEVIELKKKQIVPFLVDVLIEELPEQISFVKIKEKLAKEIGIQFEYIHHTKVPSFEVFANLLKKNSSNPKVTGMIIQQPLPFQLQTDSIYNFIPLLKEIEGHKPKSPFYAPLGLAVLTALKYIYADCKMSSDLFIDVKKDAVFFREKLRGKKIVIVGRGATGGAPIAEVFKRLNINFLNITSTTLQPEEHYQNADIIITAVGKKIVSPEMLKPGVILLNAGLRREDNKLKGDYDETEVADIARFYSPTPGGIGPLDVLYLYKNLIEATKLQFRS